MSFARRIAGLFLILLCIAVARTALAADPAGKTDYVADCARCHGDDGKGNVPAARAVPGYISVDLTHLSQDHGGHFPRQEVFDAIDGRKRFRAHFIGDMPTWGLKYQDDPRSQESQKEVRRRIAALCDYVESLQTK